MGEAGHLFGIAEPILQAPMAGAQGSGLARAVCEAGGLGAVPGALLSLEGLRAELAVMRESGKPYNVNFFCHTAPEPDDAREREWREVLAPYYREFGVSAPEDGGATRRTFGSETAELLAEIRPAVVSFHFGLPEAALLDRVRGWGAKILSTATTVDEARWLEARGVDAVIAQGWEAGGHRGMFLSEDVTTQVGTFALVPQVARAVRVPVIAAGGIADASGVRAALELGAVAAQVGTAYLLCPEATTSAVHRAALGSEGAKYTEVTRLFSGRPARGIVNRLMRELGTMHLAAPAFPLASGALAPLRAKAEAAGDGSFSGLWCGQNATGCRAIPAAALTRELAGVEI